MAKIIGKAVFKSAENFTKEYVENEVLGWAKVTWESLVEIYKLEFGLKDTFTNSLLYRVFADQYDTNSYGERKNQFPDLSSKSTCQYSGNPVDYLNGSMTLKERIVRKTFHAIHDVIELHLLYQKAPVFDVIESGLPKEVEDKLNIILIKFGNTNTVCLPKDLFTIEFLVDYTYLSSAAITAKLEDSLTASTGLVSLADKSIYSIQEEEKSLQDIEKQLKKESDDIMYRNVPELAEMQKKIDKLQVELNEKVSSLKEQLAQKQEKLRLKKQQLENELFLLETQIYSLRCQNGEVFDVIQIRRGKNAPENIPVTLFQKVKYMDNELGYLSSIYNVNGSDSGIFEKLMAYNDTAFETFCPTDKCIVVMRATEHSRYAAWNRDEGYNFYEKYHGNKTAILLRNGENLYAIWTDDDYINISGNAFFQTGKKSEEQLSGIIKVETKEERASRIFLMNILQGIFDEGKIFPFPEKVSLLKPTPYIAFSYADSYVTDNRFGTLADIQKKCNQQIKKGDKVILLTDLQDGKHWTKNSWTGAYGWEPCDRSRGESNRTNNCSLKKDEIYDINLTEVVDEEESYYIRALKTIWTGSMKWGFEEHEAGANFRIYPNEVLNLTFANSVWLTYVLINRNIGNMNNSASSKNVDYAGLVKSLKVAKEYLEERERTEKRLIQSALPEDIRLQEEWQVSLSEWKIANKVRNINEYQAKRFAVHYKEVLKKGK